MTSHKAYCILESSATLEVLTTVIVKSAIYQDVMSSSLVIINQHFGRTYCLHFQCRGAQQVLFVINIIFVECMYRLEWMFYGIIVGTEVISYSY